MELSKAIISGSAAAATLALHLLSLPRLMCLTPAWSIALETEELSQHGEAQVSENVVISDLPVTTGKAYIADNVAPGPYTWKLTGYIPGNQIAEPSNLYTPFVRMNVARIRQAYKAGTQLSFKDGDNVIYPTVVIQSLVIETRADCKNKVPFAMTLKEINILDSITGSVVETASTVAAGLADGEALNAGSTASVEATSYSIAAPAASYGAAALASTPSED